MHVFLEAAFVGQHRLGLDQRLYTLGAKDVVNDAVVLGRPNRPVDVNAIRLSGSFELHEIAIKVAQRVLLDLGG
jgi:hypothetical protein